MNEKRLTNFAMNIDKQGHEECWEWLATKNSNGYGQFGVEGRKILAHRASWELFFGEIPKGKLILHKCNNKSCVNPYHLYIGDYRDNMVDAIKAGHSPLKPPKLYDEEIWLIRRLLAGGIKQRLIARMFKVD